MIFFNNLNLFYFRGPPDLIFGYVNYSILEACVYFEKSSFDVSLEHIDTLRLVGRRHFCLSMNGDRIWRHGWHSQQGELTRPPRDALWESHQLNIITILLCVFIIATATDRQCVYPVEIIFSSYRLWNGDKKNKMNRKIEWPNDATTYQIDCWWSHSILTYHNCCSKVSNKMVFHYCFSSVTFSPFSSVIQ